VSDPVETKVKVIQCQIFLAENTQRCCTFLLLFFNYPIPFFLTFLSPLSFLFARIFVYFPSKSKRVGFFCENLPHLRLLFMKIHWECRVKVLTTLQTVGETAFRHLNVSSSCVKGNREQVNLLPVKQQVVASRHWSDE